MTDNDQVIKVVNEQLDAYNARDLDRFLQCYVENVKVCAFPSGEELLEASGTNFKQRYKNLFEMSPNLNCQLVSRCLHGNIVMDQEIVTGFNNSTETKNALAIYEVKNDKISRVWFVK